jgi:hypothetical protein
MGAAMALVKCPHCGISNDPVKTAGYCDECGKKLPGYSPAASGYARSKRAPNPQTVAEARRWGAIALFTLALFQILVGGGSLVWLWSLTHAIDAAESHGFVVAGKVQELADALEDLQWLAWGELGTGLALFVPLGFWAVFRPLWPTILGLLVCICQLAVAAYVVLVLTFPLLQTRIGAGLLAILIVKLLMVLLLFRNMLHARAAI